MECPTCDGIGRKISIFGNEITPAFSFWKKCWLCRGTGELPKLFDFVKRCMLRYAPILSVFIFLILCLYF